MTLLTIVQRAARGVGIPVPAVVSGSTDPQVLQLLEAANKIGEDLMQEFDWNSLTKEHTFSTVATEEQVDLSTITDFNRIKDETMFNRSKRRFVFGPLDPDEWQAEKTLVTTNVRDVMRIRGNAILFANVPAAGETIAFEYVSQNWAENAGGTGKDLFDADTDVGVLDERLIQRGAEWWFLEGKGGRYDERFRAYEKIKAEVQARDGGNRTRFMGGGGFRRTGFRATAGILNDSGFG